MDYFDTKYIKQIKQKNPLSWIFLFFNYYIWNYKTPRIISWGFIVVCLSQRVQNSNTIAYVSAAADLNTQRLL